MNRRARRYFLVKVVADKALTKKAFSESLANSVDHLFGHIGLAEISPQVVSYDQEYSTALVKCSREGVQKLRATLALITKIENIPAAAFVLRVSGTIRGLRRSPWIKKRLPQSGEGHSSLTPSFGAATSVRVDENDNQ